MIFQPFATLELHGQVGCPCHAAQDMSVCRPHQACGCRNKNHMKAHCGHHAHENSLDEDLGVPCASHKARTRVDRAHASNYGSGVPHLLAALGCFGHVLPFPFLL